MASTKRQLQSKKTLFTTATTLFVIAVIFYASTLRTPLTGVGPIISYIRDGLGISNALAGFLTTIPLLAFAIISPFAPHISRRFGMEYTLFYSVILLTIGVILRSLGNVPSLLIGTVFIGIAISFGNVLFPSFFKLKFPTRIGILTAVYTVSMNISGAIAAGISQPLATSPFGWQGALSIPIVITVASIIAWIPILRGKRVDINSLSSNGTQKQTNLFTSPLAWAIALTMGLQSLLFYCSSAWIPEILISQGLDPKSAGWMVSFMQLAQIPMTFLIPIIAEKLNSQHTIVWLFTILYMIGFAGVLFQWTSFVLLWMICLGLAGGASFGLVLMFFTLRTKTAFEAAQISGFAQSVGYFLAAVGPVLFGYLHDATNSWNIPIVLFIASALLLFVTASISSRNRYI